ncbi:MAG: N-acetyltransferase [Pseudonocardiales bacterium]|nr:N-acetyltransferase [Pseudonocardiales bacterium]
MHHSTPPPATPKPVTPRPATPKAATPAPDPARWFSLERLTGRLVDLVPLAYEHAAGYLAAAQSDGEAEEVFRSMALVPPVAVADAQSQIAAALAARARGERLPYAQLDPATGAVIGTTSFYEVNPALRSVAIGHTWLGHRWWRTGHNTESKLLLLTHAFDVLGAVRVVWHTDIRNIRSQAAIERLGAVREGVLRKHRIRLDGSWRDTVQYAMFDEDWPAARDKLSARLLGG